jgi:hypothetical protein
MGLKVNKISCRIYYHDLNLQFTTWDITGTSSLYVWPICLHGCVSVPTFDSSFSKHEISTLQSWKFAHKFVPQFDVCNTSSVYLYVISFFRYLLSNCALYFRIASEIFWIVLRTLFELARCSFIAERLHNPLNFSVSSWVPQNFIHSDLENLYWLFTCSFF